ncbi:hypothetical protein BaRGS_00029084 [Batillaria attramentaria]|uniref:Uncharacterized protein n=1 Tax=Batillaria attramentaria TaxID=370345 RepID=A0ABD0JXS1_9CAEN
MHSETIDPDRVHSALDVSLPQTGPDSDVASFNFDSSQVFEQCSSVPEKSSVQGGLGKPSTRQKSRRFNVPNGASNSRVDKIARAKRHTPGDQVAVSGH